jgi:extracellular matrix regulatory protein A
MGEHILNIGYGNMVAASRVVAILSPGSAPMKRMRDEARQGSRLIDATQGKRTRSIIVTDSNHVILSAFLAETIAQRLSTSDGRKAPGEEES